MQTAFGHIVLPILADSPLGGATLVVIGGAVVVLAIILVFVMVLRGNGGARNASRGIGFDAQEGPIGQPRAPMSQPNAARQRPGVPAPQQPWSMENDLANTGGGWGNQDGWGAQPASPQAWNEQPSWGRPNAPRSGAVGTAPSPWDAPATGGGVGGPGGLGGAGGFGGNDPWSQPPQPPQPQPQQPQQPQQPAAAGPQGWAAPPTAPRGWGNPSSQDSGWGTPAASSAPAQQPDANPWGAPPAAPQPPVSAPDWGRAPAPSSPYDGDKTSVVRPRGGIAQVVVRQGKEPGRAYELRKDRTTIGRSRESDIFLEDLAVSRLHTTINRDATGQYYLRDENSANGTLVNGQRITEHLLEEGDEIQVGQTVLAFIHR